MLKETNSMKKFLNQRGISQNNLLLILIVLVVIGGLGINAFLHRPSKPKASTATSTSTTPVKQPFLTVNDWAVKFPLSDIVGDAYYRPSIDSEDANGVPGMVWLGLASLDNKGNYACNASLANQTPGSQIGAFLRLPAGGTDAHSGKPYAQLYPNGITLGSYYYAYKSAIEGKTCTSKASLQAIDAAFAAAAKHAFQIIGD